MSSKACYPMFTNFLHFAFPEMIYYCCVGKALVGGWGGEGKGQRGGRGRGGGSAEVGMGDYFKHLNQ